MEHITAREATTNDWSLLQEIGRKTFYETFAASNTPENMEKYLKEGFSEDKLRMELSDRNSQFYLALMNDRAIGYLKLNMGLSQTEMRDSSGLEIERIYVLQEVQGKKVGQALYAKAMEVALRLDVDYVWLGVWEENKRAINFYTKNGFVAFDQHVFKLGDDEQTDIMMKKILKADSLQS